MSEAAEFTIGAVVECRDGECGELRRVVIESDTDAITHLVVSSKHQKSTGHLVSIDLVESTTAQEVRLRCTLAQFAALDDAEETEVRTELSVDFESQAASLGGGRFGSLALNPDGLGGTNVDGAQAGMRKVRRGFTVDNIPDGEGEVSRGQRVHASDGHIGHVHGLVDDPSDHKITYILLDEGHLWGEKEIAIPISAVKFVVDDGVYLNLTRKEVGDLPAVGSSRTE
ncbi:MAG: PRC-barrel domain-containing protein [Acidimicrobiales bacterium]